jgi:hypothetical protein
MVIGGKEQIGSRMPKERYDLGPGLQRVQIVRPRLHHLAALQQVLGEVVRRTHRITFGVRTRWREIGAAFENRDASLTVLVDAVPLSGRIILMPPKKDREEPAAQS